MVVVVMVVVVVDAESLFNYFDNYSNPFELVSPWFLNPFEIVSPWFPNPFEPVANYQ